MLKLIIWIVIAILVLSFFGISLHSIVTAPTTQENFGYLWGVIVSGFNYCVAWVQVEIAQISNALPFKF